MYPSKYLTVVSCKFVVSQYFGHCFNFCDNINRLLNQSTIFCDFSFLSSGGGSGLMGSVVGGSVGHMLSDKAARKAAKKAAKHGQYPPGQYPQGQYPPGHNPSGESFNFTFFCFQTFNNCFRGNNYCCPISPGPAQRFSNSL